MTRVTRFAGRDPGPIARVVGFITHLRNNGLRLGVAEADLAMTALTHVNATSTNEARQALRAVCTGCREGPSSLMLFLTVFGWMRAA